MNDHLLDDDDRPVGRVLTRREVLALFGLAGSSLIAACVPGGPAPAPATRAAATTAATETVPSAATEAATEAALAASTEAALPACVVRPEMTEGPYFVQTQFNRADVRAAADGTLKEGAPLSLTFAVAQIAGGACTPLPGAVVDIWHCDAQGVYSGVGGAQDELWLRGYQETGPDGVAEFLTIYPGWYPGRAVHIHFKIRTGAPGNATYDFTSQLFFDEAVNAAVYSQPPYAARGLANVPNERDGIFRNGGDQLLLVPVQQEDGSYRARLDIALDLA